MSALSTRAETAMSGEPKFTVAQRGRRSGLYNPAADLTEKRKTRDDTHHAAVKATRALNVAARRAHDIGKLTWEQIGDLLGVKKARAEQIAHPRTTAYKQARKKAKRP